MTVVAPSVIAVLLAYCFAALGGMCMDRRPRSLSQWNQSFLVGLAITATVFFPLSVLLPGGALTVTLVCLILTGVVRLRRSIQTQEPRGASFSERSRLDLVSCLLLCIIGLLVIQFAVQNFRLSYLWDGYQIWGTKALIVYHEGALGKTWLEPGGQARLLAYPSMVPLYEALLSKLRGTFDWNALKPIFLFFYASMLISTFCAARQLVSRPIALGGTALLALLPAVSTRFSVGGYADMPQAAFVAGVVAAMLHENSGKWWQNPVPWLIGGLVLVKGEGMILALVVCVAFAVYWFSGAAGFVRQCRQYWHEIAIAGVCLALRFATLAWLNVDDPTYGPLDRAHLIRAYNNLLLVPATCMHQILNVAEWSIFWPAFGISAIVVAAVGNSRERILVGATIVTIVAYTSIFYLTNWDITLHINQAYSRLLVQVAPAAVIGIAAAYARILR